MKSLEYVGDRHRAQVTDNPLGGTTRSLRWVALDQYRTRGYGPKAASIDAAVRDQLSFQPREGKFFWRKERLMRAQENGS